MNRESFGRWGAELSEGGFACALAALGVLFEGDIVTLLKEADFRPSEEPNPEGGEPGEAARQRAVDLLARHLSHLGERGERARWRWYPFNREFLWYPDEDRPYLLASAGLLADAWMTAEIPSRGLRLVIDADDMLGRRGLERGRESVAWLMSTLSHPDVGASSVTGQLEDPSLEVGWQWPLRVGLLGDERSEALRIRLTGWRRENEWATPLWKVVDGATASCDLLLLPLDLRAALAAVAALPSPSRADAVIALGRSRGGAERWVRQLEGLRAVSETSGVGLVHVSRRDQARWFGAVLRELSHGTPLDVALFQASNWVDAPPPFVLATGRLLEFSRLAHQVERAIERLSSEELRELRLDVTEWDSAGYMLELDDEITAGDLAERIRLEPLNEAYLSESGMATAMSEMLKGIEEAAAESSAPPERAEPRYIQAQWYDLSTAGERVRRRLSLRAGAAHELMVRIGRTDADWDVGPRDRPFPDAELPPDQEEHRLTVVFTRVDPSSESGDETKDLESDDRKAQVRHIVLPREGDSSACRFTVYVSGDAERVEGRLLVLHRNRVLQTALVRGSVGGRHDEPGDERLSITPEVRVRHDLGDLAFRVPFDASILVNHSESGVSGVTVMADADARAIRVSGKMDQEIAFLDRRLSDIAYDMASYEGGLRAPATEAMLRTFAQHGSLLYSALVKRGIGEGGLARGERLQVISAIPEARLPVEFIYDRDAPLDEAPLCEHAEDALREGSCRECAESDEESVVCPLGFWGLSRIIERHGHDATLVDETVRDRDFAFRSDPTWSRNELDVLRSGMVGGSVRVDESVDGGLQQVCDRISDGSGELVPVSAWDDWVEGVGASTPSIVALIVHVERSPGGDPQPRMEIGDEDWLKVALMKERHLRPDPNLPGPLVLLLGCETGAPDIEFLGLVSQARERGASVVVASGSAIHSVHAVPVTAAFVDAIRDAIADGSTTFGEVMRTVRRELLADGLPMVLSLTAYGDADWQLVTSTP